MKKLVVPPTNIKDCFNNYKIMQEEGPSTHAVLETIHWVYEHRYESDNLCKAAKIKPIQISDLVWGLIEMARNICMEGEKKENGRRTQGTPRPDGDHAGECSSGNGEHAVSSGIRTKSGFYPLSEQ